MTLEILLLTVLIAVPLVVVLWALDRLEKGRKKRASADFRSFTDSLPAPARNLRGMRRVLVPSDLDVTVQAQGPAGRTVRGTLQDLSLSGAAVSVRGGRRHLHAGMELADVEFRTPVNRFRIQRMRLVRQAPGPQRRVAAFQFQHIDGAQFDQLQRFLGYLESYQKHETAGH